MIKCASEIFQFIRNSIFIVGILKRFARHCLRRLIENVVVGDVVVVVVVGTFLKMDIIKKENIFPIDSTKIMLLLVLLLMIVVVMVMVMVVFLLLVVMVMVLLWPIL